ncbi:glutathione S-transferase family protein [Brevundimonas sp. MEB006b]|uniref:glutathione S-transferase family protein n=1 Tax=Brevundimonas sp. MEB006b TaxID=3040283 RepID=UPI00254C4ADE|nr:glutathione S-transferase family protein [Brevundimonas sp. MEB006b]
MITVTAFKWVPPFAAGQVRDHRVRWILNEAGWAYEIRLLDAVDQKSAEHRALQPFGQVPTLEEDGRPPMFESGAIVWDIAERAGVLIPPDPAKRAQVLTWYFAALNSVEGALNNVAEAEFFLPDEAAKAVRRAQVLPFAEKRLSALQLALGDRRWLVGETFTVADLMMSSVLKIAASLDLLKAYPALQAYFDRCLNRPAYRKAVADQCATIAAHGPRDMRYREAQAAG